MPAWFQFSNRCQRVCKFGFCKLSRKLRAEVSGETSTKKENSLSRASLACKFGAPQAQVFLREQRRAARFRVPAGSAHKRAPHTHRARTKPARIRRAFRLVRSRVVIRTHFDLPQGIPGSTPIRPIFFATACKKFGAAGQSFLARRLRGSSSARTTFSQNKKQSHPGPMMQ